MTQRLLGWRKFIFTALVVLISVILLLYGKLTGDQFVSLNQIVVPAFLTSNLIEWVQRRKERNGQPSNSGSNS